MVASNDSTAPRVVIIGITGKQGGSVANVLVESSKPYRLVGLTRSVTQPAATEWENRDVEMREVTVAVRRPSSNSFRGSRYRLCGPKRV
jgi:uncharacterized protein YbjT (DUF2867 family)